MNLLNQPPPLSAGQMRDLADLAAEDRRQRDQFDGVDQLGNPARPTRLCSTCGEPEGKRRDIRPTQYVASPTKVSPASIEMWQNSVHWSCQPCRRKWQGLWRIPSYHPKAGAEDEHVCYAQQLVPDVRAITLQEPWAWLIAEGFKSCENRKWSTVFEGRVFIHSAKSFASDFKRIENWVGTHMGIMIPGREWLQRNHMSRIVAVAEFGPMQSHLPDNPWKMKGQWAWPITWCHRIKATDPVRGMLGLWRLPTDLQRIHVLP